MRKDPLCRSDETMTPEPGSRTRAICSWCVCWGVVVTARVIHAGWSPRGCGQPSRLVPCQRICQRTTDLLAPTGAHERRRTRQEDGCLTSSNDLLRPTTADECIRRKCAESWTHDPKVAGSNPAPATKKRQVKGPFQIGEGLLLVSGLSARRSIRGRGLVVDDRDLVGSGG